MNSNAHTRITSLSWGEIEVSIEGERHRYRDCKIWPGGAREWDWNETGTQHSPGIQVEDVAELVEKGVSDVILSLGQQRRLGVKTETEEFLTQQGIKVHKEETGQAVERFNQLSREGVDVAGVFHTTC